MSSKTGVFLFLLGWASAAGAAPQDAQSRARTLRDPELHLLYHHDISRPLREMPVIPPIAEQGEERLHPVKLIRPPRAVPHGWKDPLAQATGGGMSALAPLVSTMPGLSFDGVGVGFPGFSVTGAPPDTNGAAGATQYVQWVNTSFAVFDKATGARVYGPAAGNSLWQGFGGACETTNSGDPVVMYDKAANRWVMTQFSINQPAGQFFQCVAVSTTSDASGSYRRFAYNFTAFNDYPKGGVWPDGYYITFNMFNAAGTAFQGARVCALDRNQMITASGTPGAIQCFQLSSAYGGLLPADLDGATPPPAGSPNYMVAFDDVNNNGLYLWKFHVDWANSLNSTLTGPTKITTAVFSPACGGGTCIPQPGTTQRLDSLADRLMFRLAYRNFGAYEALVVNHSVTVGTTASGVRWYEVRSPGGTPTLFQSGTFSPDATSRWMGSIAQDQQGNMLLGYSASSSTVRPSIYYTGRLVSDAPDTMQAETLLTAGVGSQTGGLSRWGDYSAMTIDPVDDCTFWYTNQYLKTTGSFNWSTRIGSFKFPGCGGVPVPDFYVSASPSSLSIAQGSSGNSSVTVTSLSGFNSTVDLSCTGLPAGVTCAFNPTLVTPPANGSASSTLTVSVASDAVAGGYSFQATGVSGSLTHGVPVSLTVTGPSGGPQAAVYDATLRAPKCGTVGSSCDSGASLLLGRAGVGPEPNQPNTINSSCADGTTGVFHFDESNDRVKVSTLDGTDFASGKTVRVEATVWAYATFSADRLDLYYAANAASPTWSLLTTLTPPAAGAQTLSATYTLPAGALQAVRVQFRFQGTVSACTAGSYNDHDDLVFAVAAPPPPTPDFGLSASPSSLTIAQGASGPSTLTITSLNSFSSGVGLSCTGLPGGASCGFSPATVTPPANGAATSALSVTVDAGTATGSYAVSVVGVSGSLTHNTPLTLTVTPPPPPPPDFGLSASPSSLTIEQGASGPSTLTITSLNGFSSGVGLSCTGLPGGASCGFSPAAVTPPANGTATSALTVSVDASTATGSYAVSVVGISGSLTHNTPLTLTVTPPPPPPPDFGLSASPSSLTIAQGASGPSTLTITSLNGFSSGVGQSCTGLPSGATCGFSPATVTPPANGSATSALTVSVDAGTATGSYAVSVVGISGSLTHATPLTLTVTPAGGGSQTAVYDATLKAPKCAAVGSSCDSGPSLLLGRNTLGPEPNQPNTINTSCTDGVSGSFHSDESNDRIKVSTLDGTDFAAGQTVRIDATLWAWTTPSADMLDLYYTADAASPTWTLITTLTPPAAGAQTLSATYTLPVGSLQAVRAQFRYQGTASACTLGSYNDHDDLVFAVAAPPPPPPDFGLSASPSSLTIEQGASGPSTLTITSLNGFSSGVGLSCTGLPSGATCGFSPAAVTPPANGTATSALSVTVGAGTATGSYAVSVVGISGSLTHNTPLTLTVTPPPPPPPDFGLSASPSSLTIAQGASGPSTLTITSLNSFSSGVDLSCTGLPSGATCGFSPAAVTPPANGTATSALSVTVGAGTATGSYAVSVVAISGSLTHSTALSLTVTPAGGGPQTAVYDATLKAPKCAAVGSSCDSGPSLLLGRNTRGPEPNQPNTINTSCTDGASGVFHFDESNDRIKVSTTDATSFAAGKTVRIDATVWAYATFSADRLDLYYTANAASPTWTLLTTIIPTAAGAQTLSATYTLPAGSLQAVRAQFRFQGSATACTLGGYNDHDDLIFAVP